MASEIVSNSRHVLRGIWSRNPFAGKAYGAWIQKAVARSMGCDTRCVIAVQSFDVLRRAGVLGTGSASRLRRAIA